MSTTEDPDNILNELQDFLNQYSVDDSQLGESSEYSPGAFVSATPLGMTPRLGASSRNSPRLLKQSLSNSDKSIGEASSPTKFSPTDSIPGTPRFRLWASRQTDHDLFLALQDSAQKNAPKLIRQSSIRSSSNSKGGKDPGTPRKLPSSVPNGSASASPRVSKQSDFQLSSSLKKKKYKESKSQKADDKNTYQNGLDSNYSEISNVDASTQHDVKADAKSVNEDKPSLTHGSVDTGKTLTSTTVVSESSNKSTVERSYENSVTTTETVVTVTKTNLSTENEVSRSEVGKTSHLPETTGTSKDCSNTEPISANKENSNTAARVPLANPSIRGDDSSPSVNTPHLDGGGPHDNSGNRIEDREVANILNSVSWGYKKQNESSEAGVGRVGNGGGNGEGNASLNKDKLGNDDGSRESNLGPFQNKPNQGEADDELSKAQNVAGLGAGKVGPGMGNNQSSESHPYISQHGTDASQNFSFGNLQLQDDNVAGASSQTQTKSAQKDKSGKKKSKKKSKEKKDHLGLIEGSHYYGGNLAQKADMYEIVPDDEKLDDSNFGSPGVPELIVDVLKADVNSDGADGYSTPSLDIDNEHGASSSNRAETSVDEPLYATPNIVVKSEKPEPLSDNGNSSSVDVVDSSVVHTQDHEVNDTNHDNDKGDDDEDGPIHWRSPDSGLHYPIIYRRSKKDPGSKEYGEVVKELSSVLEKRAEATRSQSMREVKSGVTLTVDQSSESKRISKSSESVNVFANKSLLSKLENHLISKNLTDKLIHGQQVGGKTNSGTAMSDVDVVNVLRKHENNNKNGESSTRPGVANSGDYPPVVHPQSGDDQYLYAVPNKKNKSQSEPVYAVPNKGPVDIYGKRVSAKLIYDHSTSFSKENESATNDFSVLPDDLATGKADFVTVSNTGSQNVNSTRVEVSGTRVEKVVGTNENSEYEERQREVYEEKSDEMTSRRLYEKHHQQRRHHHYHEHQEEGHSLSWAHGGVDNRKSSSGVGTILAYTPPSSVHNDSLDNNSVELRRKPARPLSSSVVVMSSARRSSDLARHSLDDSSGSSQGHSTVIHITGSGLRRQSMITYSEPDLTQGSVASDTASDSDTRYVITRTDQNFAPHARSSSSLVRTSHHHQHNHHRRHHQHHHHHSRHSDHSKGHHSHEYLVRSNGSFDKPNDLLNASRGNISFDNNQSYDLSFGNETFEEEEFHGYYQTHGSYLSDSNLYKDGANPPHMVKVNVIDRTSGVTVNSDSVDGSSDTYFINTFGRPTPVGVVRSSSSASAPPRSHPHSMTTIVEHSRNSGKIGSVVDAPGSAAPAWSSVISQQGRSEDKKITVMRAMSLRSNTSTATSSSRAKIVRSHTLDHNDKFYHSPTKRTYYRIVTPKNDLSFASDHSMNSIGASRSHGSMSTLVVDNDELTASNMYVVVPPQPSQSPKRVPDLIVDHQDGVGSPRHYGSPFHQDISEGTLPPAHGEGLYKGEEDKPASFMIDARNMKGEPAVQVDGPNAIAKCSIDPLPDGQYKVTYIPVEVGLFDVYVRWNGKEIPGSPFHPKVVDARKVKVVGGWQHYMDAQERVHLVVGEEKQIPFDTSEAGPGQLRAEVKSPSAFIPVEVDDSHKGKSVVKFVPKEEGNHYIHLYWSDVPLVNSPYLGYATSGVADPSKVWLSGRGLKEAVVREEAEFIIDGSQAGPGEPDVELTGVRAEIQVFTTPLGGGKFRCTYIPVIPGAYLLNISWNGRQLRGAPYKVNVIGASYPNRVVVNGEGLRGGLLGHNLDFRIDTRKAGPGELTAYCMGPSKVAYCELSDHHDGTYRLVVRPQETGRHVLQIKYGGEHVSGSPFPFKVSAQPDASKVRVSGPGVEHGILANFQSQFIVETRGAGAGQLTVRIRGPKGAFQVEMYRESQKDRTILCRYYPSVTGLYIINVRWSGVDVPGSPFHVHILDTQQELEQVLHEQSFSGSGHHHHLTHPGNSFHNTSINSNHMRYSGHQNHSQVHNVSSSRSSGYYQWKEGF